VVDFLIHEVFYKSEEAVESFGNTHLKTPIYSLQSNAAERVNRSVLAAFRGLLDVDHRYWDSYLRNAIYSATGEALFLTVFGHHMSLNGANYKLASKLKSLCDPEISGMKTADKLRETAYKRSRQRYDQRARAFLVKPGQDVYRYNFVLSDLGKTFNAKFSNNAYELKVYHAKDIRL